MVSSTLGIEVLEQSFFTGRVLFYHMASKKQFVFIVLIAFLMAVWRALAGIPDGGTAMVIGFLAGAGVGGFIGWVIVAIYNSRTEDEVLTVEDVQ